MSFSIRFNFSWPCHVACGVLVPQPGIKPVPPAVEAWSLTPGSLGNTLFFHSLFLTYLCSYMSNLCFISIFYGHVLLLLNNFCLFIRMFDTFIFNAILIGLSLVYYKAGILTLQAKSGSWPFIFDKSYFCQN